MTTDNFVPAGNKTVQQDTSAMYLPTPVRPDAVMREAIGGYTDMVGGYLKTLTPRVEVLPPVDQPQRGVSNEYEIRARNERFRFVVGAIVLLAAITAGGLVLLFKTSARLDGLTTLASWLAITGIISGIAVWAMHRQDSRLTPEGLESERMGYLAVVEQTDAESRAKLADAYAHASRADADARAHAVRAQADALLAETKRIADRPVATPAPRRAVQFQPVQWVDEDDGTPVVTPVAPPVGTPVQGPVTPLSDPLSGTCLPPVGPEVQGGIDATRTTVLEFVASLYDADGSGNYVNVHADGTLKVRTPWSARGDLSGQEKERVRAALDRLHPALFETGAGNQQRLNLRAYSSRRHAVRALGAAL